jgi:putative phosphotransacetylase
MDNNNIELITRLVMEAIESKQNTSNGYVVPIGASARHIHLTQEHVEILFGEGYKLTKKKELMGGQFASNELVTIVGLKLRAIENVRVLGPVRSKSQVEISATDAIKLGVKAPIRPSPSAEPITPFSAAIPCRIHSIPQVMISVATGVISTFAIRTLSLAENP